MKAIDSLKEIETQPKTEHEYSYQYRDAKLTLARLASNWSEEARQELPMLQAKRDEAFSRLPFEGQGNEATAEIDGKPRADLRDPEDTQSSETLYTPRQAPLQMAKDKTLRYLQIKLNMAIASSQWCDLARDEVPGLQQRINEHQVLFPEEEIAPGLPPTPAVA